MSSVKMNLISKVQVSEDYYKTLKKNNWQGNIRELRNTVERSLILMNNNILDADSLPLYSEQTSAETDSLSIKTLEKNTSRKYYNIPKVIKPKLRDF